MLVDISVEGPATTKQEEKATILMKPNAYVGSKYDIILVDFWLLTLLLTIHKRLSEIKLT